MLKNNNPIGITMKFNPMTIDEIKQLTNPNFLLREGIGRFEVTAAEEVTSKKSGNPMIKLELSVEDQDGKIGKIFDYIFYSDKAKWKLVSFCVAASMEARLEAGTLTALHCNLKTGYLLIVHEKDDKGEKRNKVKRYLMPEDAQRIIKEYNVPAQNKDFPDDDLPF